MMQYKTELSIAAEQRVGLSDATDVALPNYQVSSSIVSPICQWPVSIRLVVLCHLATPTSVSNPVCTPSGSPTSISCLKDEYDVTTHVTSQPLAVFPSPILLASSALPHYTYFGALI